MKPTVLEEIAFTSRLQIWPSLCVLFNALENSVADFKRDECKYIYIKYVYCYFVNTHNIHINQMV